MFPALSLYFDIDPASSRKQEEQNAAQKRTHGAEQKQTEKEDNTGERLHPATLLSTCAPCSPRR